MQQQQQALLQQQQQQTFNPSAFNERAMAIAANNANNAASSTNNTTGDLNSQSQTAANNENNSGGDSPSSNCDSDKDEKVENIPKGLVSWRDAVSRSHTTAQLAMALYVLESCVAWDKSIMKAVSFCFNYFNYQKIFISLFLLLKKYKTKYKFYILIRQILTQHKHTFLLSFCWYFCL